MNRNITRRYQKLNESYQSFILKLITDSHFILKIGLRLYCQTSILLKLAGLLFLVDKGYKWKGPQTLLGKYKQIQMTRFEFWLKLQIVNEKNVEIKDEAYFYIKQI